MSIAAAESNASRGIVRAGFLCGVAFIATATVRGCVHGEDWRADVLWSAVFGGSALLLLWAAGSLGIRVLLRSRLPGEIARGNLAAGIAAGAHYAATGLIIARCLYGDDLETLGISVVFFVIAQATLHLLVLLFRRLTLYAEDQEIIGENVAAALSYAGAMLALAIIVGHSVDGDFDGWGPSMKAYAIALASALVLYPVRQLGVQTLLLGQRFALRGGGLDQLVARERNVGASAVEAVSYIAAAALLTGVA
jgi:uncharacterized membrane protein YjfL (UPF0719 family)